MPGTKNVQLLKPRMARNTVPLVNPSVSARPVGTEYHIRIEDRASTIEMQLLSRESGETFAERVSLAVSGRRVPLSLSRARQIELALTRASEAGESRDYQAARRYLHKARTLLDAPR